MANTISVICVCNDIDVLTNCLSRCLESQTCEYELFIIDNSQGVFLDAASALNAGASKASGDWLMFVHQDVVLIGNDWLDRALRLLNIAEDGRGWFGVAGRSTDGSQVGFLVDRTALLGEPGLYPSEAETLDECLLIRRRVDFVPFRTGVSGWHVYGVDACLIASSQGLRNFALPLLVHHQSRSKNMVGLAEAHAAIYRLHGGDTKTIWTSCGLIGRDDPSRMQRCISAIVRRLKRLNWAVRGWKDTRFNTAEEIVDKLLDDSNGVRVVHRPLDGHRDIEVSAICPSGRERRVRHQFTHEPLVEMPEEESAIVFSPSFVEWASIEELKKMMTARINVVYFSDKCFRDRALTLQKFAAGAVRKIVGQMHGDVGPHYIFLRFESAIQR